MALGPSYIEEDFFVFFNVSGYSNTKFIFWGGFIFLFPVILLVLTEKYLKINYRFKISKHGLIKLPVEFPIVAILLIVSIAMFTKMELDFNFSDQYERRFLAREKISGLLAYFFEISSNGLAPILAFLAIYNRNYKYILFAFAFALADIVQFLMGNFSLELDEELEFRQHEPVFSNPHGGRPCLSLPIKMILSTMEKSHKKKKLLLESSVERKFILFSSF
jgi:hypothetical protein